MDQLIFFHNEYEKKQINFLTKNIKASNLGLSNQNQSLEMKALKKMSIFSKVGLELLVKIQTHRLFILSLHCLKKKTANLI